MDFPKIDPNAQAAGKSAENLFRTECHKIFPLEDISQEPGLNFEQYGDRNIKFKRADKIIRAKGLHDVEVEIKCRELKDPNTHNSFFWLDKQQSDQHRIMAKTIDTRVVFAFYEREGASARLGSLRMISLKKVEGLKAIDTANGAAIIVPTHKMMPGLELLYKLSRGESDLEEGESLQQVDCSNRTQTWNNLEKSTPPIKKEVYKSTPPILKSHSIQFNWSRISVFIFLLFSILLALSIGIFAVWLIQAAGSIPSAYSQLIEKINYEILNHHISEEQMLWLKIAIFVGGVMSLIGTLFIIRTGCRAINRILGYRNESFRPISVAMTISTLLVVSLCSIAFQMRINGVTGWTFIFAAAILLVLFMIKKSWNGGRGILAVPINFIFVGLIPVLCWLSVDKGLWKQEGRQIWSFSKIEIRPAILKR